jgi:hypothetical protein
VVAVSARACAAAECGLGIIVLKSTRPAWGEAGVTQGVRTAQTAVFDHIVFIHALCRDLNPLSRESQAPSPKRVQTFHPNIYRHFLFLIYIAIIFIHLNYITPIFISNIKLFFNCRTYFNASVLNLYSSIKSYISLSFDFNQ